MMAGEQYLLLGGSQQNLRPFAAPFGTLLADGTYPYHQRQRHAGAGFKTRLPDGTHRQYVHPRPCDGEDPTPQATAGRTA